MTNATTKLADGSRWKPKDENPPDHYVIRNGDTKFSQEGTERECHLTMGGLSDGIISGNFVACDSDGIPIPSQSMPIEQTPSYYVISPENENDEFANTLYGAQRIQQVFAEHGILSEIIPLYAAPPRGGWLLVSETRDRIPVSTASIRNRIIGFFPQVASKHPSFNQDGVRVGYWLGDYATVEGADGRFEMTHWQPWPKPPGGKS